jgi:hypothetical protein
MSDFRLIQLLMPIVYIALLGALRVGIQFGNARLRSHPEDKGGASPATDAAVFALLGLLIAFTFSGAAQRFDRRRDLIVQESNAIGTAYLRLDLLPAAVQPQLREAFRSYVDARLAYYRALDKGAEGSLAYDSRARVLQRSIWKQATAAAAQASTPAPLMLVTASLNDMIDITSTRAMSLLMHPPIAIYLLLTLLALLTAMLAGFGMAPCGRPSRLRVHGFALMFTLTVYVTLDMEYPRYGLIRVDSADQLLIDARRSMQ